MAVSKHLPVYAKDQEPHLEVPVTEESMARRRQIAAIIRERMAVPPTEIERELWEELKSSIRHRRLTAS
jgi:hypothetical protein